MNKVQYMQRKEVAIARDNLDSFNLLFLKMERKLAARLLIIIGIWIIGWTPIAVLTTMQLFGYGLYINKIFPMTAMLLCKISSVLNCGIYGMRYVV